MAARGIHRFSQMSGRAMATTPSVARAEAQRVTGAVPSGKLLLPSQRSLQGAPEQGWKIPTRVGQSRIQGAGNGRFSLAAVPKSTRVVVKPYMAMREVQSLRDVPFHCTITFENEEELERYIHLSLKEGGFTREQVLQEFADFIYGFDGYRACLNNSTWSMNHADHTSVVSRLNVEFVDRVLEDGTVALVGRSTVAISPEEELTNNYRDFVIPPFYMEFCKKNQIKDVRTMVIEALGEQDWREE